MIFHASSIDVLAEYLLDEATENIQLPRGDRWSVHKFGGTCVGNSERIRNVADVIIQDQSEGKLIVVSAMSKVTDMMYDLIYKAQSRDESYLTALDVVLEKHKLTAMDLLDGDDLASFLSRIHHDINNLKAMLRAIYIGRLCFPSLPAEWLKEALARTYMLVIMEKIKGKELFKLGLLLVAPLSEICNFLCNTKNEGKIILEYFEISFYSTILHAVAIRSLLHALVIVRVMRLMFA